MVAATNKSKEDRRGLANAGLSVTALGVHARYLEATAASLGGVDNSAYRLRTDPSEMPYKFVEA